MLCDSGTCDSGVYNLPPGAPCNMDADCESGDCKPLVFATVCWGSNRNYHLDLYDYMEDHSGTDEIEIYVVNNDQYEQDNTYQKKIVEGPVSYRGGSKSDQCLPPAYMLGNTCMCGVWPCSIQPTERKDKNLWQSRSWTCGGEAFHDSDWGYSVIICNNSGNGFYIDRLEIMKSSTAHGKTFGAHGM